MSLRGRWWGGLQRAVPLAGLVAGLVFVFASGAPAAAADAVGPAFGANTYTTEISSPGADADTDDYVAPLVAGETLTVSIKSAKGSALLPTVVVLDPDGVDRTPQLKIKSAGRKVSFKKLAVDATGPWTVRIAGDNDTEGAYSVKFKLGKAKPISLKKQTTTGGLATHAFGSLDGALATIQVKYAKSGAPLSVAAMRDPSGDDAVSGALFAVARFVAKGTKLTLKKEPLAVGDGDYELVLTASGGEATYNLKISIAPQARPTGKSELPAVEPLLDPVASPIRGVAGRPVQITGQSLGTPAQKPRVLFGGLAGNVTSVATDGSSLTVIPPLSTGRATVAVSVVDPFGQASQRDDYFTYVPAPTLIRIESPAGAVLTGGPSTGGDEVRLIGAGFEDGQVLRLGGAAVGNLVLISDTEWSFTTPAFPAGGGVTLTLTDAFGRNVVSPFVFNYKRPPILGGSAATTYSPTRGAESGGTVVTVLGQDFELQDRIEFDGAFIASTIVSTSQRRFTSPARAPGSYTLALVDRYGVRAEGPDFEVKAAPAIASVSILSGSQRGGAIGIGGGAVLRIDGSGFAADDVVTIGGQVATPTSRSDVQLDVPVPPLAPGSLDVVVTDELGSTASVSGAATAAGLDDVTSTRSPRASSADDLGAVAAAVGDLDRDGDDDDVVLVGPTGGSTAVQTRQLRGNASGALVDVTTTTMPNVSTDPLGVSFDGGALAIGDLDGVNGPDIIVADNWVFNTTTYYYYDPVRVLLNDGTGSFSASTSFTPAPSYYYYRPYIMAYDEYGNGNYAGLVIIPQGDASTTALAIGDLDDDGDDDVVTTSGSGAVAYFYFDPAIIDFTTTPYYVYYDDIASNPSTYLYVFSATRILDNDSGLSDVSLARIGIPGNVMSTNPSYHGRDLAIGDIDGANGLDIVVTWDDPLTASVYGAYTEALNGTSYDVARVSTRLLFNDGSGTFTDRTTNWLPGAIGNEFWQGDAVELVDILGSTLPDLLILHDTGPSATTSALRVLRNDGAATGFTDVTATVLPTVSANDNLGGTSLLVHDVDGDGRLDIVIGTTRSLTDTNGNLARSTRVLFGTASGTFAFDESFQEAPSVDSGETRFLLVGDMTGSTNTTIILGDTTAPANGPGTEKLRVFDWED